MMKVPNEYRVRKGQLGSDDSYGNNGMFYIKHPRIEGYNFIVQVSDGAGWEHVSVSLQNARGKKYETVKRCPTWEDMCFIKDLFWDAEDCVIQFHPPASSYVSHHPYCLHMWKSTTTEIEVPETILIGPKSAIKQ